WVAVELRSPVVLRDGTKSIEGRDDRHDQHRAARRPGGEGANGGTGRQADGEHDDVAGELVEEKRQILAVLRQAVGRYVTVARPSVVGRLELHDAESVAQQQVG